MGYCDLPVGRTPPTEGLAHSLLHQTLVIKVSFSVFFITGCLAQHQESVQIRSSQGLGMNKSWKTKNSMGLGGLEECRAACPTAPHPLPSTALLGHLWVFYALFLLTFALSSTPRLCHRLCQEPASSRVRESWGTDQAPEEVSDTVSLDKFSTNSKSFLQGRLWFPSFELAEAFL